jgi:hypothetical protein
MWQHFSDSVPDDYQAFMCDTYANANARLSGFDVNRV